MSWLTTLYGSGEAANGKTPAQLDAELRALQASKAAAQPDKYGTPEYEAQFNDHMSIQEMQDADIEGQLQSEFDAGLKDSTKNLFGKIPWWVWVAGVGVVGLVVLSETGLLGTLLRSFKKK